VELVFLIGYPFWWIILPVYQYTQSILKSPPREDRPILIHAASVGEINAVTPLIKHLVGQNHSVLINTITVNGRDRAQKLFPTLDVRLAPLDLYSKRSAQLKAIKPCLILVVETEIWPNMLYVAGRLQIPIIFVNARISQKTLVRYLKFRALLRFLSPSLKKILAQSELDQNRLQQLFSVPVENSGNLKYCLDLPDYDVSLLRAKLKLSEDDFVIVWGSSRPKEEELLLSCFPLLKMRIPNLRLIIAPRHPKRSSQIERLLKDIDYALYSKIDLQRESPDVLLIDSLGHLTEAYSISDISIVGGSFYDFGGHNPLEPAFYGKPVIMGEYYSSCRDSVKELLDGKAICISSRDELPKKILELYAQIDQRKSMGQRARLVLTKNATALDNHIRGILPCLK